MRTFKVIAGFLTVALSGLMGCGGMAHRPEPLRCIMECTPRMGVLAAFGAEADILLAETANKRAYTINGNQFTTGDLRGNQVVIALTGVSIANAAMTTQLMIDHFN